MGSLGGLDFGRCQVAARDTVTYATAPNPPCQSPIGRGLDKGSIRQWIGCITGWTTMVTGRRTRVRHLGCMTRTTRFVTEIGMMGLAVIEQVLRFIHLVSVGVIKPTEGLMLWAGNTRFANPHSPYRGNAIVDTGGIGEDTATR